MSSVAAPITGVRATAAAMLPASLRAGMTTETVSGRRPGPLGCPPAEVPTGSRRATMKMVRQNHWSSGASQRLINEPRPSAENGARIRAIRETGVQPASRSRFRTSDEDNQLFCG